MDIKAKIDEIVNKVKSDPDIASKFQKDPIKTVEGILGVDLPDDVIRKEHSIGISTLKRPPERSPAAL